MKRLRAEWCVIHLKNFKTHNYKFKTSKWTNRERIVHAETKTITRFKRIAEVIALWKTNKKVAAITTEHGVAYLAPYYKRVQS